MINAVIFDLDGLLADTERLHLQAYQDIFALWDLPLSEQEYADHWIRDGKGIAEYVEEHNLPIDPDAFRRQKAERYHTLVRRSSAPMPGALRLIKTLHGHRALAVASSSYERDVRCVLESVGITRFFDVLASKESAERLKPHPDIFLYVARRLSAKPSQCLVLEDAQKGVLAAHAAGMPCIAVPNEFTRDNDFSKATRVVDSLADVTPELIDSLSD